MLHNIMQYFHLNLKHQYHLMYNKILILIYDLANLILNILIIFHVLQVIL